MLLASLTSSIESFVANHGVYAVFALMAIDAVFPAASELVLLYAGAVASGAFGGTSISLFGAHIAKGAGAFVVLALSATLGYLAGSIVGWGVGIFGGRPLLDRHGRWLHLPPETLDRAERWFDRFGRNAVFLGRILPVVRSFISIPAGVFRYPLVPYVLLTLVGSALWSFALGGIGYGVGSSWERAHRAFSYIDYVVVAAVILAAAYVIVRRWRARNAEHPAR